MLTLTAAQKREDVVDNYHMECSTIVYSICIVLICSKSLVWSLKDQKCLFVRLNDNCGLCA